MVFPKGVLEAYLQKDRCLHLRLDCPRQGWLQVLINGVILINQLGRVSYQVTLSCVLWGGMWVTSAFSCYKVVSL